MDMGLFPRQTGCLEGFVLNGGKMIFFSADLQPVAIAEMKKFQNNIGLLYNNHGIPSQISIFHTNNQRYLSVRDKFS